jgi:hypothetical protein
MRALVVYESMYGNTHHVADAIADGLADARGDIVVAVRPVGEVDAEAVAGADLVVVGGPTHVHGMSRPTSRASAVTEAGKPDSELHLDADADPGAGVREWLKSLAPVADRPAAAFDTRIDIAPILSGRASKAISRALDHHGFRIVAEPISFLVTKDSVLVDGELERAKAWGATLAEAAAVPAPR